MVCDSNQHQISDYPSKRTQQGAPAANTNRASRPRTANQNQNPRIGTGVENSEAGQSVARTPSRVFAMDSHEIDESANVVEGIILVSKTTCKALFNPGATHSFIASSFTESLKFSLDNLPYVVEVSTPMGDSALSTNMLRSVRFLYWIESFLRT